MPNMHLCRLDLSECSLTHLCMPDLFQWPVQCLAAGAQCAADSGSVLWAHAHHLLLPQHSGYSISLHSSSAFWHHLRHLCPVGLDHVPFDCRGGHCRQKYPGQACIHHKDCTVQLSLCCLPPLINFHRCCLRLSVAIHTWHASSASNYSVLHGKMHHGASVLHT